MATTFTVTNNDPVDTLMKTLQGDDRLLIRDGGKLSVDGVAVKWSPPVTGISIENAGVLESIARNGRAIDFGGPLSGSYGATIENQQTGIICSVNDAIRIDVKVADASIFLRNSGTIVSTGGGQAIDFDTIAERPMAGTGIVIDNLAGGRIEALRADAVRPGSGTVVKNAGVIISDGVTGDKNDAIDWQNKTGEVHNAAGGLISGQRHGITSDVYVTVFNEAGATIVGRNGSGIGSDGGGRIVNHGRITGSYAGEGSGDGDGIDIDGLGYVDNYGIIEGTGAGGLDNAAEGVLVTGGGIINNYRGATITGTVRGVLTGSGTILNNYGVISATSTNVAFDASDGVGGQSGQTINNHEGGRISGNMRGIFAGGGLTLQNDGSIYGFEQGVFLIFDETNNLSNSGSIEADFAAIQAQGGTNTITSSGTISGNHYGILLQAGTNTIDLSAASLTRGSLAAIHAMGISDNRIANAGIVEGGIVTHDGTDVVVNSGSIKGVVALQGGDDTLILKGEGVVRDVIDGGDGIDTLDLSALAQGGDVALENGQAKDGDTIVVTNVERIIGSAWDDNIKVDAAGVVRGFFNGGNGRDTLDFSRSQHGVRLALGEHPDTDAGTMTGVAFEHVVGSAHDDVFLLAAADREPMMLYGGDGYDTLDLSALTTGVEVTIALSSIMVANDIAASRFEEVRGTAHDDVFSTRRESEIFIRAGAGNDRFTAMIGNNTLDGGSGLDEVRYEVFFNTVSARVEKGVALMSYEGLTDRLESVENIAFRDGYFTTDLDGPIAQVTRLYLGTLNRSPNAGELKSGSRFLGNGGSASELILEISGVRDSLDFKGLVVSDKIFIDRLYGKIAESDVVGNKSADLAALGLGTSRETIASAFFESEPFKILSFPIVEGGAFVANEYAKDLYSLYHAAFGRNPDGEGYDFWNNKLSNGTFGKDEVLSLFTSSPEWNGNVGQLDNAELVDYLYDTALKRHGDDDGRQFWISFLDAGHSKSQMVMEFAYSTEHQTLVSGLLSDGLAMGTDLFIF